ncbi:50S ribosomal protein L29 [Candidatus Woesearchaeota archaeon]|nr:50S ribosomal protein L29 [Candidatus Woesearchaeota archaeon]
MSKEEAESKLPELRKELMVAGAQIATGTAPKSPGQMRQLKRAIAVILTRRKEKKG